MTPHSGLVFLTGLALGGCAQLQPLVGPDYQPPKLTLPVEWSQSASSRASDHVRWWQQLGDPLLDKLVDEALVGSFDLRLAEARLRQARAGRDQAVSSLFPSLSASTGVSRNMNAVATPPVSASSTYDAGFDASWEVDLFGGARRGIEAGTAAQAASEASLNNVRVSLVAEVAQNCVELRSSQLRLAITRDNLTSQSETLEITQWRNQAGLAASSDVEQARTNREQTRAGIPDLEIGLAQAENRLAVLLGRPPGSPARSTGAAACLTGCASQCGRRHSRRRAAPASRPDRRRTHTGRRNGACR